MITSTRNKAVVSAARLKKRGLREQYERFLVEGAQATGEALAAGAVETVFHVKDATGRVPEVVEAARKAGVHVLDVSDSVMAHLTSAVTPQGLVAVASFIDVPPAELPGQGVIPVLCSVRDPGNAGAIVRSADAAGASGVAFTADSVDVYNPKTVRASAGSLFHLPLVRGAETAPLVEGLKARGMQVLAADAGGELSMYQADLTRPTAILFGNEAWGLREETWKLADASVRVPIRGRAESLNLAAAAALLLFEAARQAETAGGGLAELIGASVHDFRLPLTAVKGFASTLVDRWDDFEDPARRELVSGMLLDLERIAAMITLLVDTARVEQGGLARPQEAHEVTPTLESIAAAFARSRDYPEVVVEGHATARIEPSRLQAVVLAMCEGAMWWGQSGPIRIRARSEDGEAVVEVSREGSAPEDADEVFREDGRITLHMARRVVQAVGGRLDAFGNTEVSFRLKLP